MRDHYTPAGTGEVAETDEPPEALAECVKARALRDEHVEVEVRASLDALSCDEDERPPLDRPRSAGLDPWQQARLDPLAIDRAHSPGDEDYIGLSIKLFGQRSPQLASGGHPIHDDRHGPARGEKATDLGLHLRKPDALVRASVVGFEVDNRRDRTASSRSSAASPKVSGDTSRTDGQPSLTIFLMRRACHGNGMCPWMA